MGWGGATDSGSGVASYQAYSKQAPYNGAFEAASLFKTTSAPGSGTFRGHPGNTYGAPTRSLSQGRNAFLTGVQEKRLALVAITCPGCGSVQVFQGTTLMKQVSLDAESVEHRVIPIASFPSLHRGKVRIRVASSGEPVIVDGLGVSRVF